MSDQPDNRPPATPGVENEPQPPESAPTQAVDPRERDDRLALLRHEGRAPFIPGYRLLRVLASGGMGTVYEAEQQTPRRNVALKVILAGQASQALLRRFDYEAQVLGLLHHPGIAQIYEAGTFNSGEGPQPYIAMELIEGLPLMAHAGAHHLSPRESIELLALICDAVHHAHQKGVIHRDLKPDNILIESATGGPKIVDFGVSRVTGPLAAERSETFRTRAGMILGTVAYMSPEQASGNPDEIDTRADIYALGVIAYQLLAGRMPLDFGGTSLVEAARVIREVDPPRLSSINRLLRGDLETIVAKALEKDKRRRYQSAAELAQDLRHHLRDEPINARPPGALYQWGKFARRNRVLVASAGAAFVMLLCGAVATGWQARQASRQRDEARRAREAARAEAARAERVAGFLVDIFNQAGPGGRIITAREILDEGARRVTEDLRDNPEIQSRLMLMIGRAYAGINEDAASLVMQKEALAAVELAHGAESREMAGQLVELGEAYVREGRHAESVEVTAQALDLARRVYGDDSPEVDHHVNQMAWMLHKMGYGGGVRERLVEAESYRREFVDRVARHQGRDTLDYAGALNSLGRTLSFLGKAGEETDRFFAECLDIMRRKGGDSADHAVMLSNAGGYYESRGDHDAAEICYKDSVRIWRKYPWNAMSLGAMMAYGSFLNNRRHNYVAAEPLLKEFVERHAELHKGEVSMELSTGLNQLALSMSRMNKLKEAGMYTGRSIQILRRIDPTAENLGYLSDLYVSQLIMDKRQEEAEAFARDFLPFRLEHFGGTSREYADALRLLSRVISSRGQAAEARRLRDQALSIIAGLGSTGKK